MRQYRRAQFGLVLAITLALAGHAPAQSAAWTGAINTNWNTAGNWNPSGVPNSAIATVNFTGSAVGLINISASVQAYSLSFSNPTGSYTLTSSAGVSLGSVQSITVGPTVTGTQTINLANVTAGSLLFPIGSNLTITNNSAAAGTTLVIGPNTVIGTLGLGGIIVGGVGTTQFSGSFSNSNFVAGGLTKNGSGNLILSTPANNYTGGTFVNAGTLMLGSGTAIPVNSDVSVGAGATFNTAGLSNGTSTSSSNAIGTLDLNGGTLRAPTGNGDYWLNELSMTHGTVDYTGTSNSWLHFTGANAAIDVRGGTNACIGSGTSRIQNDTASPLRVVFFGPDHLDLGMILSAGGTNPNFQIDGQLNAPGFIRLSNTRNTGNIGVFAATLLSNDLSTNVGFGAFGTLGTGTFSLNTATLNYDGPTAASAKPIALTGGGDIQVANPGVNLTMNGILSGGYLNVFGSGVAGNPSTLTLAGANTYIGGTQVLNQCVLAIPTIANGGVSSPIGASSNDLSNLKLGLSITRGDLLLTGTNASYSTDRGVTVDGLYSSNAGGGIGVQNAATTLTWNGQITGSGSLIKTGAGTLTLTYSGNAYLGGTYVEAGRLLLGAGTAIPSGTDVTIQNGAIFDTGGFSNIFSDLGTITINGGTLRVSNGNSSYFLNRLVTGAGGGAVDVTGLMNFTGLVFTGGGAAITINGNSAWTGPSNNFIANGSDAPLTFTVAPNVTLTSSLSLQSSIPIPSNTFLLTGGGTLYLTNPPSYPATVRVNQARLRIDSASSLGSGQFDVTLDNGTLQYGGSSTAAGGFAVGSGGGTVEILNAATSLILTGPVAGAMAGLTKTGPGALVLTSGGSVFNGLTINAGAIMAADDNMLGAGPITVNPAGTLRYTGNTSTVRTFTLFNGTLEVSSGAALTMNGSSVGGGFLRGAGTFTLTGQSVLSGTTTFTSATVNQIGPAAVNNFTNGGTFTNGSGTTLTWTGGLNQSSGNVTFNGTANVSDFTNNGYLNIPAGGVVNNSVSNMTFGGGSTTFVGSVANPGGKIDLGGQQLLVRGGYLVTNAGSFGSGNGVRNGTTVADYGALVKGTGPYQAVITQNGGQYLPGNSPGTSQVGQFFVNGGGNLIFEVTDAGPSASFPSAPGTPGTNPGWGLTQIFSSLEFTATPSNKFNIDMRTQLAPPAAPNSPGPMSSFDPTRAYSWLVFDLQPGAVFNGTFNPNAINFITTQFANPTNGGQFSLSRTGGQVFLTFTPVPEPATILGAAFAGLFGWRELWRRRPETRTV